MCSPSWTRALKTQANCVNGSDVMPSDIKEIQVSPNAGKRIYIIDCDKMRGHEP